MSEIPVSDELADVIFTALDHGIDSVKDGGPLIPFVLTESGEERELARFPAETLEKAQTQARQFAASSDAERVALAYDGYLTVAGERSDAVFVEAWGRGCESTVVFAQRYRPAGRLRPFSTIGNATFVGERDGA